MRTEKRRREDESEQYAGSSSDGFDEFLDAFIEDAIESNGCYCGGGGKEDELDVVVELGRRSDDPDARLSRIAEWLSAQTDVENWSVGEEFDIWHGDLEDIDGRTEQQDPV